MTDRADERYIEVSKQLDPIRDRIGIGICVLIIASTWGDWRGFAIAVALHALVFPFNMLVNRLLVPKFGPRVELPRSIANMVIGAFGYTMIGWPLAVWLWLPFSAFAFDAFGGKHTLRVLVATCAIQGTAAILDGVPPVIPLVFTVVAFMCYAFGNARLKIIREMMVRAEDQHAALAEAHASLVVEVATRERMALELRQAQKLEAIGRLAAGVAHEINTPMQFIGDSLQFVSDGVSDLLVLGERYAALVALPAEDRARSLDSLDADVPYLVEHVPKALALAADGVRRVAAIVSSLQQFGHPARESFAAIDVNQAVEHSLTISRNEYRLVADVTCNLGELPAISCNQLDQILVNIIVNAAHAIAGLVDSRGRGLITISTAIEGAEAVITIADTGGGIDPRLYDRVFEPFFTTKDIGRGTGQGLALARAMVERHEGTLTFESVTGVGTTFYLRFPLSITAIPSRRDRPVPSANANRSS